MMPPMENLTSAITTKELSVRVGYTWDNNRTCQLSHPASYLTEFVTMHPGGIFFN